MLEKAHFVANATRKITSTAVLKIIEQVKSFRTLEFMGKEIYGFVNGFKHLVKTPLG